LGSIISILNDLTLRADGERAQSGHARYLAATDVPVKGEEKEQQGSFNRRGQWTAL